MHHMPTNAEVRMDAGEVILFALLFAFVWIIVAEIRKDAGKEDAKYPTIPSPQPEKKEK